MVVAYKQAANFINGVCVCVCCVCVCVCDMEQKTLAPFAEKFYLVISIVPLFHKRFNLRYITFIQQ